MFTSGAELGRGPWYVALTLEKNICLGINVIVSLQVIQACNVTGVNIVGIPQNTKQKKSILALNVNIKQQTLTDSKHTTCMSTLVQVSCVISATTKVDPRVM